MTTDPSDIARSAEAGQNLGAAPQVSLVMPCLNEAETLEACIREAKVGLTKTGYAWEIIVADNGSTDSSRDIAERLGAIVIRVPPRGYGSALQAGTRAARGRWIIMGDADMSYDFSDLTSFVEKLAEGNDLVMGCRLPMGGGRIMPGAMPRLNRWVGNPILSFLGRRLFRTRITDFHCGIRAYSRDAFLRMDLETSGMEFATEMVVKAALKGMRIAEVPVTLRPDGRSRPPHLRPWRDGWRHLRFMLLFSPRWLFFYPGLLLTALGLVLLLPLSFRDVTIGRIRLEVGALTVAGMTMIVGVQLLGFALWGGAHPVVKGALPPSRFLARCLALFSLERGIVIGAALALIGLALLGRAFFIWNTVQFGNLNVSDTLRILVPAAVGISVGLQVIFTSFFLSLLDLKTERAVVTVNTPVQP